MIALDSDAGRAERGGIEAGGEMEIDEPSTKIPLCDGRMLRVWPPRTVPVALDRVAVVDGPAIMMPSS